MILKMLLGLVVVLMITATPVLLAIVTVKLDEFIPPRWLEVVGLGLLVALGLLMCYLIGDALI